MKTFWARRPHVVEVVMFDGKNFDEIRDFCADWISSETTGENPSLKIRVMGPVLYKEEKNTLQFEKQGDTIQKES